MTLERGDGLYHIIKIFLRVGFHFGCALYGVSERSRLNPKPRWGLSESGHSAQRYESFDLDLSSTASKS